MKSFLSFLLPRSTLKKKETFLDAFEQSALQDCFFLRSDLLSFVAWIFSCSPLFILWIVEFLFCVLSKLCLMREFKLSICCVALKMSMSLSIKKVERRNSIFANISLVTLTCIDFEMTTALKASNLNFTHSERRSASKIIDYSPTMFAFSNGVGWCHVVKSLIVN